jgi:DNA-binding transcriptional MerR regulator
MNDEPILPKAYYSIGEVCDLTGLKPHVLRYWETQFTALSPTKNRAGNRVYRPREVELVLLVKNLLYEEKFTIEGARKRIREMRKDGGLAEERADVAGPELFQVMKQELARLRDVLDLEQELDPDPEPGSSTPPEPGPPAAPDKPSGRRAGSGNPASAGTGMRASKASKPTDPPRSRRDDPFPQLPLGMDEA